MRRIALEPGYLLSRRPYRETSALLEVFSEAHGRIGLVARGVQRAKSPLAASLRPFQKLLLSWSEGGELGTLASAEAAGPPAVLPGDAVVYGWYVNELLLRLLPRRDAHPALFRNYETVLGQLRRAADAAALRVFEWRLLAEMGYGLQLPDEVAPDGWYGDDAECGLHAVPAGTQGAYRGSSLLALARGELESEQALIDARRLLKNALRRHLGNQELQTPRLLRSLRRIMKVEDTRA